MIRLLRSDRRRLTRASACPTPRAPSARCAETSRNCPAAARASPACADGRAQSAPTARPPRSNRLLFPSDGPPRRMLFVALPGQVTHFLVHYQAHQRQPGFAHEMAHAFLQQTDHLGHRENHLQVGVLVVGQLPELLNCPLLVNLISSLHSDSLLFFLAEKTTAIIMTAVESRYFLRINGHPLQRTCGYSN